MKEIDIDGTVYNIGRLNVMKQFHVQRRVAPIMAMLGISVSDLLEQGKTLDDESSAMIQVFKPIMDLVAKMSDEDSEYIIKTCLSAVQVRQGDAWAKMMTPNGLFMFEATLDTTTMVRLTIEVIKENLGGFFSLPSGGLK